MPFILRDYIIVLFSEKAPTSRKRWTKEELKALYSLWKPSQGKPTRSVLEEMCEKLPQRTLLVIRTQCYNLLKKEGRTE